MLRRLGGQLVEVRIDSLQANTFVASLYIRHGEREILLEFTWDIWTKTGLCNSDL